VKDANYINFLERVVLALLKEREKPQGYWHDVELEVDTDGVMARETVAVYNLKKLIEERRRR